MTKQNHVIAIDLMGGDDNPLTRLRAIQKFNKQHQGFKIQLFVGQSFYQQQNLIFQELPENINVELTEDVIQMDDSPLLALRQKRNSSLSLAIQSVAQKKAQAILTAGNSGALVAFAKYWLKVDDVVEKPALATVLPGYPKPTLLLDIGASLEYRAEDLYALAELGAKAAPKLFECGAHPEVALLNVGTEHIKGHDTIQQADRLLQSSGLNYLGFCEGSHLFSGYADVICCDGFVGNVTLKACEGLMKKLQNKQQLKWWQKWFCQFIDVNLNPAQYNGALLLGLDGLVVKAHGNSDEEGFYHALLRTADYVNKQTDWGRQ
jgi:glycerol-3-phosphate acyltransferase PlsX